MPDRAENPSDRRTPARPPRIAGPWAAAAAILAVATAPALAGGRVSWLDDVVREVVREAEAGGRIAARSGDGAATALGRGTRLFARQADESLEVVARRADAVARLGRRAEPVSESVLASRFARLVGAEPELARTFSALAPAEKRLVVEMGETAGRLARRFPGRSESMIRALGTDGLSAVRAYGDDVAEVLVKEGPEGVGVLRKAGRGGWAFFTEQVLPHKKKLAAAGVLALFLADPDRFVDTAGRATQYAVDQFSRAGLSIAGAVASGAARGLDGALGHALAAYGLNSTALRYLGMGLAGMAAAFAALVLLGLPVGWMFRPAAWVLGRLRGGRKKAAGVA